MNSTQFADWTRAAERFLYLRVGGVDLLLLLLALLVVCVVFVFLLALQRFLKFHFGTSARTGNQLHDLTLDLVASIRISVLLVVAIYAGSLLLPLPRWTLIVGTVTAIVLALQLGICGNRIIAYAIRRLVERHSEENSGVANAAGAIGFLTRITLWSGVALLILGTLRINITALVAGLGIGGVAVALALQNILGDLFASLSILLDKPFAVGHFIVVDDVAGTVEHVGIKSTRIRSLSGEEIILANGDLLKCRIHNYKKLLERRVLFTFGITYNTPSEKLATVPAAVRAIIEKIPKTRFDRAHFKEFGDSALNFEVVYFVLDQDYNLYMDIQQQINLAMVRRFAEENIEFAFPTRTLYVISPETHDNAAGDDKQHGGADGAREIASSSR
jgi:small-conductance mechanosensitive channel